MVIMFAGCKNGKWGCDSKEHMPMMAQQAMHQFVHTSVGLVLVGTQHEIHMQEKILCNMVNGQ